MKLTEQMSKSLESVPPPEIDDSGTERSLIDHGRPPQYPAQRWSMQGEVLHQLLRNLGQDGSRRSDNPLIHRSKNGYVQIAEVAGNEDCGNLSRSSRHSLVARGPPLKDDIHASGLDPLRDDVSAGFDRPNIRAYSFQSPFVFRDRSIGPLSLAMRGPQSDLRPLTKPLRQRSSDPW